MFKGVKSLKEFCSGKRLRMTVIAVILGIMCAGTNGCDSRRCKPWSLPGEFRDLWEDVWGVE